MWYDNNNCQVTMNGGLEEVIVVNLEGTLRWWNESCLTNVAYKCKGVGEHHNECQTEKNKHDK